MARCRAITVDIHYWLVIALGVSEVLSVVEAAEKLDLDPGRVRRLVASGLLAGQKIGGRWLVDEDALAQRLAAGRRAGRPLSARSAWGLLWAADGRATPWLAPRERSRALERARSWPISDWPWVCGHRAAVYRFRAHPAAVSRLLDDDGVVRGGVSARGFVVDLIVSDEAEVYVRQNDLASVVADYAMIESRNANVIIRVPPADLWLADGRDAAWPVVVVDLLDAGDDRSVRAAYDLADRMSKR